MEGGSSPNLSHYRFSKHAKINPTFPGSITMLPLKNTTSTSNVPANMNCYPSTGSAVLIPAARPSKGPLREQDQYMPIANVIRIMRRVLPSHAKISDDAKETIQECVSEYISFITGEANDRCQREQRKTVTAEDILWAMEKLGFDDYIEPLTLFLNRYREMESDRSSLRGEPFVMKRTADFGGHPAQQLGFGGFPPPLPSSALYPMGHPIGVFDPSTLPPHTGGYYGGGGGGAINDDVGSSSSSSTSHHQAAMAMFDHPYAHFK